MKLFSFINPVLKKILNPSLSYVLFFGLMAFIYWANHYNLDQTVTTHGQIISEEKIQIIQAVDGGVLTQLKVHEGQEVKAGEVLATLQKDNIAAGYDAALADLEASKAMQLSIEEEYDLTKTLLKTGDVGYLEVARLKRQLIEMQGRVKINEAKLAQQKVNLSHTELMSPVDGSIKVLRINTIGGVLRPGEEIMQIAPLLNHVMIEIKISPADIGSMKIGLPVMVKFDTYDFGTYGSLKGTLTYISPDSFSEQAQNGAGNIFYKAYVTIPPEELSLFKQKRAELKLGMSASIDIKTGSRSVVKYILKPIYKGFEGAFHEK